MLAFILAAVSCYSKLIFVKAESVGSETGGQNCLGNGHVQNPPVIRHGYPKVSIKDFGGVGDGVLDSHQAFEAAIHTIRQAGGGLLEVPCGVFRTAPLQLASHMTLYLHRGAIMQAIDDPSLWKVIPPVESYGHGREGGKRGRRSGFLWGEHLEDVKISGDWGTIDGNGWRWWNDKWGAGKSQFDGFTLPHLLELRHSRSIEVSNLHLVNSPFWTVHPFACKGVTIRNVEIVAPEQVVNTDGIDPDSCEDVLIENVVYSGGDDAVAIKSGWDCFGDERGFNRPTRNVIIRNLTVRTTGIAATIAIGSEMSGGVENILIEDSRVERAGPSGGAFVIKSAASRGGFVRNVTVKGLEVGNVSGPGLVVLHPNGFQSNPACSEAPAALPEISGISLINVRQLEGTSVGEPPVFFGAVDGQAALRALHLDSIHLRASAQPEPAPWKNCPACWGAELSLRSVSFGDSMEPGGWLRDDGGCSLTLAADQLGAMQGPGALGKLIADRSEL